MPRSTRREFLTTGAAAATLAAAMPLAGEAAAAQEGAKKHPIPRRPLGRTGMNVSVLGLGCGSQFLALGSDEATTEMVHAAMDGGVNYFDSAWNYGNGNSLRKLGLALESGGRRQKVYVTSKSQRRERDVALRELEGALRNLKTDYIDLFQIHLIAPTEDLDALLGPNGVYRMLVQQKEQKVIRNIGITGHLAARNMKTLIERMDVLDAVLAPVNPKKDSRHYLREYDDANPDGHFEELVLPAARKKNIGVIAMKVMAQGQIVGTGPGKADAATLFRWAASEPGVATCIIGPGSMEYLKENIATAQKFTPLPQAERAKLVAHVNRVPHLFAYERADYAGS